METPVFWCTVLWFRPFHSISCWEHTQHSVMSNEPRRNDYWQRLSGLVYSFCDVIDNVKLSALFGFRRSVISKISGYLDQSVTFLFFSYISLQPITAAGCSHEQGGWWRTVCHMWTLCPLIGPAWQHQRALFVCLHWLRFKGPCDTVGLKGTLPPPPPTTIEFICCGGGGWAWLSAVHVVLFPDGTQKSSFSNSGWKNQPVTG